MPHTQKVFGRSPVELTGAWAAERIKDPTPSQALRRLSRTGGLRGMPQSFLYPRKGPGELWDGVAALCGAKGARILVDTTATAIESDSEGFAVTTRSTDGRDGILCGRSIVATCPLAELARMLNVDRMVAAQLTQMPYRHLMTLVILFDRVCHLEQQLIYVTASESRFRRFQVYDKWSEELVPPGKSCFGFELTYDDHSPIPDGARLVDEATEVLRTVIGRDLGSPDAYCQLRFPHAYVRLDPASIAAAREVSAAFTDQFPRLYLAGRHGEFEYMNQDAAFKSGASAARAAASAG